MEALLFTSTSQGYVVVPDILSPAEVHDAKGHFAAHRHDNSDLWLSPLGQPGLDISKL